MPQSMVDVYVAFLVLRCIAALPFALLVFGSIAVTLLPPVTLVAVAGFYAYMFGSDSSLRLLLVGSTSFWVTVSVMLATCHSTPAGGFASLAVLGFVLTEAFSLSLRAGDF